MKKVQIILILLFLFLLSAAGRAQVLDAEGRVKEVDPVRILLLRADKAYNDKDYEGSAQAYISLLQHKPGDGMTAYSIACNYSLMGKKKEAIKWLGQAVEWGFYGFEKDTDLNNISHTGQYKKILIRARQLIAELRPKIDKPVMELPQDYDSTKTYGLLVCLHGYSENPSSFIQTLVGVPQQLGYIVVAPYGPEILGKESFGWGNSEETESKVLSAITEAQAKYRVDPAKIILMGFSQGATRTYYTGTKNAGLFKGIIPIAGRYDYDSTFVRFLPRSRENGLKVFIMVGQLDNEKIVSACQSAVKPFMAAGITISLNIYAGIGHALLPNKKTELRRAIEWIEN